jgi:hypothetical protein
MKTHSHFCTHVESKSHITHKTLITVNYVKLHEKTKNTLHI